MTLDEWLKVGFEYDRWANETWHEAIQKLPNPGQAAPILDHIVWAQETWLGRLGQEFRPLDGEFHSRFDHVNQAWTRTLSERSLDDVISYVNTRGVAGKRQVGGIALHVIDHGTYHRGQLREIAGEQGYEDFPETGLIGFFMMSNIF
jgi:uncharacterized damage-inducible protein DinB